MRLLGGSGAERGKPVPPSSGGAAGRCVCVRAHANCPLHPCSSNAKTFQSTHSKLNIKVFKTKIKSTCYLLVI